MEINELKQIKEITITYEGKTVTFEQSAFTGFFVEKGSNEGYTTRMLDKMFYHVGTIVHVTYKDGTETEYTIEDE